MVTQFAISQVLIIGTIVTVSQMNYIRTANLGFNKDAVLTLNSNVDSTVTVRQPAFKQKLLAITGVQSGKFQFGCADPRKVITAATFHTIISPMKNLTCTGSLLTRLF